MHHKKEIKRGNISLYHSGEDTILDIKASEHIDENRARSGNGRKAIKSHGGIDL